MEKMHETVFGIELGGKERNMFSTHAINVNMMMYI